MWKCERHIPTSKMYPSVIAKCPTCGQLRPDEAFRPSLDPLPPEEKPSPARPLAVVTAPPPAPLEDEAPTVTWVDDPEPELDEEPGPVVPEATPVPDPDPVALGLDLLTKALAREEDRKFRETLITPIATEKRPKDIPVTEKSKAHLCPGPKCRKLPRGNSPYCSKICSDRCLRLRKKALRTALTDEEIKNLNRILTVLDAWNADKG